MGCIFMVKKHEAIWLKFSELPHSTEQVAKNQIYPKHAGMTRFGKF